MYIDSPNFVKRRILISNSYSPLSQNSANHYSQQYRGYEYGYEKKMLANYVADTFKSHEKDADILEKFRKEAENIKRIKRQEKIRGRYIQEQPKLQINFQHQKTDHSNDYQNGQQKSLKQIIFEERDRQQNSIEQNQNKQQFSLKKSIQTQRKSLQKYENILRKKQKQLEKKEIKIKEEKKSLQKMSQRIKAFQDEKYIDWKKQQDEQLNKISNLIEQISHRINENRYSFREELTKLKKELSCQKITSQKIIQVNLNKGKLLTKNKFKFKKHLQHSESNPSSLKKDPMIFYNQSQFDQKHLNNFESVEENISRMKYVKERIQQNLSNRNLTSISHNFKQPQYSD